MNAKDIEEIKRVILLICEYHHNLYKYNTVKYQCEHGDSTERIRNCNQNIKNKIRELENLINEYIGVKKYTIFGKSVYTHKSKIKYNSKWKNWSSVYDGAITFNLYNNHTKQYYCIRKILEYDLIEHLFLIDNNTYLIR